MTLAIASGKGGTGKTTVAVNLALAAQRPVQLLDTDVEEPNAHLFLKTENIRQKVVTRPIPVIDKNRCDGCGLCSRFCAFNALFACGEAPFLNAAMCHGCGGCMRICPQKAIHEEESRLGVIETSTRGTITLIQGRLDVGMALAPPLIRAVRDESREDGLVIIDAPPGTSCPVLASVRGADRVALVAEPTPFGLNDMTLALDVMRDRKLPFGVIINRAVPNDAYVRPYCEKENIRIFAEIPDDRRIAEAYAEGIPLIEALPEYRPLFEKLLSDLGEAT